MEKNKPTIADLTQDFGIILGTERYDACLKFYRDILASPYGSKSKDSAVFGLDVAT